MIRWGIIGCGDVTEVKSGPGFQKATGSALVAVTRRDRAKAEDYARRHDVPRVHDTADALIVDPDVDAVYIATPPSSHHELALRVAAARKPCLVEKPMAMNHAECVVMVDAFARAGVPLWVAYYRRVLPRFLLVRELVQAGAIGRLTSLRVENIEPLATGARAAGWRFDPSIAGEGLFFDLGSHAVDLLDFFGGPISHAAGYAGNTGGTYAAPDVITGAYQFASGVVGSGLWNFNGHASLDRILLTGTAGEIVTPIFTDGDVLVHRAGRTDTHVVRNPPHVHQPLIQSIVDELHGSGRCESTGASGARASWVFANLPKSYKRPRKPLLSLPLSRGDT